MEEFICCEICTEVYDEEEQCPKVLTCGHSFCSSCIEKLLPKNYCPKCRTPILKDDMESIPINYSLKDLSIKYSCEIIKEKKRKVDKEILEDLEVVPESEIDFLYLLGCYKDILEIKNEELRCYMEKINLLKGEISEVNTKVKKVLNLPRFWNTTKKKLPKRIKVENDAASSFNLDKIEEKLAEHVKTLHGIVKDMSYVHFDLIDQIEKEKEDFIRECAAALESKKKIAITAKDDGIIRYGLLDMQEYKLKIKCVKRKPKSSVLLLTIDQCLSTIIGGIVLQISANGVLLGDVMIRLHETSSRLGSKTFLHMCLFGKKRKFVKGSQFEVFPHGTSSISSEDCLPIPSDVNYEALMMENVKAIWEKGDVCLSVFKENNLAKFCFCIYGDFFFDYDEELEEESEEEELIPIGEVEKGFEVIGIATLRLLRCEKVKVVNCGYF